MGRVRAARPYDIIPWLAGAVLVSLLVLIVSRRVSQLAGCPLPAVTKKTMGQAAWWIYWGRVVFLGLPVVRRSRNRYFRRRTLATMATQTLFGLLMERSLP